MDENIPPVPIAPELLTSNPKFKLLHRHLTTNILDNDASTLKTNATYDDTFKTHQKLHIKQVKDAILTTTLKSLAYADDNSKKDAGSESILNSQLRDLILIVVAYIQDSEHQPLSAEDQDLLSEEIDLFRSNLPRISQALSQKLIIQHKNLSTFAAQALLSLYPDSIPQTTTTSISSSASPNISLSTSIIKLQEQHNLNQTHVLPQLLTTLTNSLTTLLQLQTTQLTHIIRRLEQHTYGAETRYMHSRTNFLATVAAGLEAKSNVMKLEARAKLYAPGSRVREELEATRARLVKDRQVVENRVGMIEEALHEYAEADGKGGEVLKTLGRRYAEIEKQMEVIRSDVEKLKR